MTDSKRKKYRSLRVTHRPEKKQTGSREVVLTLSVPDGEILKVEMLDKSGHRQAISEDEFDALTVEDERESSPLEDAYAAGFNDASDEAFEFDDQDGDEDEEIERWILREMGGRGHLRREVRHSVLRRLLRRDLIRRQPSEAKSFHDAPSEPAHKNG